MRSIKEIENLKDKKVLVRVDWNGTLRDGKVVEDFRIRKSLPTLQYLTNQGAKLIIATHYEPAETSLEPLLKYLPEGAKLLPNLRLNSGEASNDENFAKSLAEQAEIYVNEAFSVSHRKHASIIGVPKFLPSYAGLQLEQEVQILSQSFNPPHPFFLILGGAKFETKLPLVEKFLPSADFVFIGGGMARSAAALAKSPKVFFCTPDPVAIDANDATLALIKEKIDASKFILWNGPVGAYENGHDQGTTKLAKMLASCGKITISGGGDTIPIIHKLGLEEKFTFISTGGGATLDFLANGTLPGITALQ